MSIVEERTLCFLPNGTGSSFCMQTKDCPSLWAVVMRSVLEVEGADRDYLDTFSCAEKVKRLKVEKKKYKHATLL